MVVTLQQEEQALQVVKEHAGKHGTIINVKLQKALRCGPIRAGNVLQHLVKSELVYEKKFRFYVMGGI